MAQTKHGRAELQFAIPAEIEGSPGAGSHITITRTIDDDARQQGPATALVLDQHRRHATPLGADGHGLRVQQDLDAMRLRHLVEHALQAH